MSTQSSGDGSRFELYEDGAGDWRWRLVHSNGNILADSGQGYASKQKAQQGIDAVRVAATGAPVVLENDDDE